MRKPNPHPDPIRVSFLGDVVEGRSFDEIVTAIELRVIARMAHLPPPIVVAFRGFVRVAWCVLSGWAVGDLRGAELHHAYTLSHASIAEGIIVPPAVLTTMRLSVAKEAWDGEEEASPVLGEWGGFPSAPSYASAEFAVWARWQKAYRFVVVALSRLGIDAPQIDVYARAFVEGRTTLMGIAEALGLVGDLVPASWRESQFWSDEPLLRQAEPCEERVYEDLRRVLNELGVRTLMNQSGADILVIGFADEIGADNAPSPAVRRFDPLASKDLLADLHDINPRDRDATTRALISLRKYSA